MDTPNRFRFRAWDKINNVFVKNFLIENEKMKFCGTHNYKNFDAKEVVLMQSTGLVDKNGKEIFEGDIVRFDTDEMMIVVYWRSSITAESIWGEKQNDRSHFHWDGLSKINGDDYIPEIIGNIHENPELLSEHAK